MNTYGYVRGNPLYWTDPYGLEAIVVATPNQQGGFNFYAIDDQGSNPITGTFNTETTNFNQLRPGSYTVSPRPKLPDTFSNWFFDRNEHAGRATISNTEDWNTIRYPDGTIIRGAQFHEGRDGTAGGVSQACMVSDRGTNNRLNEMFNLNYNNGGVSLYIY